MSNILSVLSIKQASIYLPDSSLHFKGLLIKILNVSFPLGVQIKRGFGWTESIG